MLCAYMLLVIIYAMRIFVVGEFLLHAIVGEMFGVSMYWIMLVWTCGIRMKYVLLWSSPSSHTQLLLDFISMLVLNT